MPTLTKYHWDPVDDCVLLETDQSGNVTATYTHEPGPFGPLRSENRGGTEYYHHYDVLGSTVFLTSDAGIVTDKFQYDAWGNSVARTGSTPTPYQWVGKFGYQYDVIIGSYYVRERAYQQQIARWSSIDPALFVDGFNRYSPVKLSPIRFIDPTGLIAISCNCGKWVYSGGGPTSTGSRIPFTVQVNCLGIGDTCCGTACSGSGGTYNGPGNWSVVDGPPPPPPEPFPGYGNYCGPRCHSDKKPIDCIDQACKVHDSCLATAADWFDLAHKAKCEESLCNSVLNCNCSSSPDPYTCRTAQYYIALYACAFSLLRPPPNIPYI